MDKCTLPAFHWGWPTVLPHHRNSLGIQGDCKDSLPLGRGKLQTLLNVQSMGEGNLWEHNLGLSLCR